MKGKRFFLIKWDGWDESNNTWEPEKNILDKRLINIFYEEKKQLNSAKNLNNKSQPVKISKNSEESN